MRRAAQHPTPFPYTPLFRSQARAAGSHAGDREREGEGRLPRSGLPRHQRVAAATETTAQHAVETLEAGGDTIDRGDRKSTRLNSSHGYISYAVFCLKKKNET